jgi:hypothetical protein
VLETDIDYDTDRAFAILEGDKQKLYQLTVLEMIQSGELVKLEYAPRQSGKSTSLAYLQQWWKNMGDDTVVITPNDAMKRYLERSCDVISSGSRRSFRHYDKIFLDEWPMLTDDQLGHILAAKEPNCLVYGLGTPF